MGITDIQPAEESLKKSEEKYRKLINGMRDTVWVIDYDGNFIDVNKAAVEVLGYSRKDLLSMGPTDIDLNLDVETIKNLIKNMPSDRVQIFESVHTTKDGKPIPVEIQSSIVRYQGKDAILSIGRDITERKQIELERSANLKFFESMDRINRAIQVADDLEIMMKDLLDEVIAIFDCDRAFLMYPCDPESSTWTSPMERTKPEYPGILKLQIDMPMDQQVAGTLRILLANDGPVTFGPGTPHELPKNVSQKFGFKSFMSMAIYPKSGSPWQFGIHQCSHNRIWTAEEKRLFQEIGRRLGDALSSLLTHRRLKKSEERYRLIADNTADTIFIFDLNLHPLYVSPSILKLRGFTVEEALRQPLNEVLTPESLKTANEVLSEQLELEKLGKADRARTILLELEAYRKNGSIVWVELAASFLRDQNNQPTSVLTVIRDISGRKHAELQLIESEHKFRSLAENIPDNIIRFGIDGRLIFVNRQFDSTVDINFRSIIGKKPENHLDMKPPEGCLTTLKKVLKTGAPDELEVVVPNPEGELRTHHIQFVAERNNGGEIIGALAIGRDITARKHVEETLRKLSEVVEQSPVSIVITNKKGEIEFVNAKFTQITGYTSNEAQGQNPRILKSGKTSDEEYIKLWQTIGSGGTWHGEFHNRKKNGELFWEHATIAPMRNADNDITHYVAIKEDITERKKLEEQLHQIQKMEAIGQLAGGVAHDFSNMLSVIIGYSELAFDKAGDDKSLRQDVESIQEAANRSLELTQQLLAFARKQNITPKILDLNKTVEGMLKLLRRLIGEDLDLIWQPDTNLGRIKMDPSQIDQILANLCVNARDAINGVGKVTIETQNVMIDADYCAEHNGISPGEYVMLAVSDTGNGMDKPTMDKIFEPFFTTKALGKGTGMGLATVYGIVKQNAGAIYAYSESGHGSTFKIYLPRHTVKTEHISEKKTITPLLKGHETILLVEDERAVLKMVKRILEDFGYTVLAFLKPKEAIRTISENIDDIDLLITDLVMPEMNGQKLANKITSLRSGLKHLFMSGYTGNVIAELGVLEAEINFIQKPFSRDQLAAKVREVLDSK